MMMITTAVIPTIIPVNTPTITPTLEPLPSEASDQRKVNLRMKWGSMQQKVVKQEINNGITAKLSGKSLL